MVANQGKVLDKVMWRERRVTVIGLGVVGLVIVAILFIDLDKPHGEGVPVHGTTTQVLHIVPRLGGPYTSFRVKLENGEVVKAEGPPNLPIKRNAGVVLVKRNRLITGNAAYEFDSYE